MADGIGVGSALRRAREIRAISVEEAARDTKLRPDQLRAAEDEAFEDLGGEVYTRAVLRTYAEYLGLSSDKVLRAYGRHAEDPEPPSPPSPQGPIEKAMAATRIRDNQRFLLIVAVVVLAALIAVGFVSRRGGPAVAAIPTSAALPAPAGGTADALAPSVRVVIEALGDVHVDVTVDDEPKGSVVLREGETASYAGLASVTLAADDGAAFWLTVDGEELGAPGRDGRPWEGTFEVGAVVADEGEPSA